MVVFYQGDDNPRLAAYVTLAMPMDDASGLRSWLKDRLPEYMVPARFTVLDELPLTPNGKIDRKVLPVLDLAGFTEAHEAPRNETERLLCNLWSEVLGIEIASIRSDFFEAGGHSLLATQLVSRIREGFGVEMPLQVVFGQPLVREQAEWLENAQRGSALPAIMPLAESESMVLSFAQQRLWFLAQLEGQSATYNMPAALRLTGRLDEAALGRAVRALVQRHDSLRMYFPAIEGEATVQLGDICDPLRIVDLDGLSESEQKRRIIQEIFKPFDLSSGPLFRVYLFGLREQEWILLFNMHHIIGDGWSMQRDWLSGEILQGQSTYWRDKLAGIPELLELPTDYPRPAVMSYRGAHLRSILDGELAQGVRQLSRQHGVTVFMTLLAAFDVLLSRYSGQTDIVVGSPIANRTHHQTEGLIGFFVNTLALRAALTGEMRFPELLKQVRQTALDAYAHQDIPFEHLVEEINPVRSLSHSPLFQAMFVLQNAPEGILELSGLAVSSLEPESTIAKFDLTLSIADQDGELVCDWEYCTDLFRTETITRMAEHFQVLLVGILDDPEQSLSRLPLLTEAERQQLLAWYRTETEYPKDKTIVDLFQEQVEKTPDNIALVFEDRELTYGELNGRANRLAHYLMALGVGAETLVGICVERSLEMVIGLMGILKAGGAYVPLDPDYPAERLQFMLEDARVSVLLTQSSLLEGLPASDARTVCLDSDWEAIVGYSGENPARRSGPENLAYVIYTSGSTGKPKGCLVTHSNVVRLFSTTAAWYRFDQHDVWTLFHSYAFDFSVWELWGALLYGGRLIVVPYFTSRTPEAFYQLLIEHNVTVLNQTPSAFNQLINVDNEPDRLSLRLVIFGGEALDFATLRPWFTRHGDRRPQLVNMYGITETTVHVTYCPVTGEQSHGNSLIGRPIPDMKVWVVDVHRQSVPIGIPGEMLVAGAGLARGYLNRPELTAEKFIEVEVFGKKECLYKTGDLARWLPDGNIEYLGRMDHQIKLRGFRIELGEIEATLSRHEAVREAVVVFYQGDDNPRLAAYVTLAMPMDDASGLRSWLKDRLPEYMVPARFTVLDELPLTPNGKIDRKVLPVLDLAGFTEAHEAPRNETERLLCNLWSEVLGIEIASIRSDFFEAGGHSLLATQLVSRIREGFGVEMPLQVVFGQPLVREQAEWLENAQRGSALPAIMPLAESESMVLSFAQQRLWFLAQLEGQSATYNMPAALRLTGRLDEAALGRAVRALIQRHDSLRMCFPAIEGEAIIRLTDGYNPLTITDLRGLSGDEQQQRVTKEITGHAQAPFDLATGPLLRLRLLLLDEQARVLLFNMHHIIGDGWSMGVLIRDFSELYNAYAQNREPRLPELPIRYVDYAAWQRDWLSGEILQGQSTYWRDKLAGIPELLELPTDYPRPAVMSYRGAHLRSILDGELAQGVRQLSRQHGVTVFMTLLAAFDVLLSRYSGQTDIVVGSPIANRTHHQTEGLIGFFVNTLALRAALTGEMRFPELLKQVRQTALDAYAHQDIPFEHLVEEINPVRSLSHSPLFQAMFVLQNAPEGILELSGLAVSSLEPESTIAKFDLTLSIADQDGELVCDWEYCTDLFRTETITRMAEHFQVLLVGILDDPEQSLSRLPLLTEAERQQLLAWYRTETEYPKDKTIVDLFQEQVEKTPDNIALVFEDRELTYGELNGRANRLAHYLMALGVGAETLVGICVERSLEMVIGLMGILKAGGAYVPLDPDYPAERLQFMLEDARVSVLLTQSSLLEGLPASDARTVCLDSDWEAIVGYSGENPARRSGPENLAYVIYTSGSTGIPKGVCILQQAVVRLVRQTNYVRLDSEEIFLQYAPVSFDAATLELWGALLNGAKLIVMLPHERSLSQLSQVLQEKGVTVLWLTSSLFNLMLDEQPESLLGIEQLLVGGEELSVPHIQRALGVLPDTQLINGYGPTENTTFTCCYPIVRKDYPVSIPIGKPIANTSAYILDEYQQPLSIGLVGELYTGGIGLARGYLNRPELTAEKFMEVEVFGKPERLYKTGDLARWLPDGNIEYLGRMDHQIKLRGFRIELGEIETTLSRHEAVREAVVTRYQGDDNPRLAAYVTLAMPIDDASGLRSWLKTRLPEYMIPASFTVLDELPLTPNGKIDRKVLPAPDLAGFTETHEAPRTNMERRLAEVWSQVLKQPNIGVFDNFFERGGDSIISIQIVARARTVGLELNPRDLFQNQNIAELAQVVRPLAAQKLAEQDAITGEVPLTPIQAWFFARQSEEPWHFNQAVLLAVPADIDEVALRQALAAILEHHDALRLRCRQTNDQWQQWHDVVSTKELPWHVEDLGHLPREAQVRALRERADFWQASLNLETGPLVRLVLFRLGEETRLLWCIHHLAVDGISWRILVEDLQTAYRQAMAGQPIQFPPKTSAFKDWAEHLLAWRGSESFAGETGYWRGLPQPTPLPMDNPDGRNRAVDTQDYTIRLSEEMTQRLLTEAPAAYRTRINDLLLTALMLTLRDWTGEAHHLIDLESHGRTDLFEEIDLSRTVGWFTALHTLFLRLPAEMDFGAALKAIKEQLREVPHDGVGYGVLRYLCREDLPQGRILFNYLGQFDQGIEETEFRPAGEGSGRAHSFKGERDHPIEINGLTIGGCLNLTWSYSSEQYLAETIQGLADNYRRQLDELIGHCAKSFGYTPSDFPLAALDQTRLDGLTRRYGNDIEDIYPLSSMQQGMLFHSLYAPESGVYFEQLHLRLRGRTDIKAFRRVWQYLIDRHAVLRTAFVHEADTPLQLVFKTAQLPWQVLDWRESSEIERQRQLQDLLTTERSRGFAFDEAPLLRLQLIRETDLDVRLVWHFHHILMDGWCLPIVFTELVEVYSAFAGGRTPRLPPIRPYRAYISWLGRQDRKSAKGYWQEQLSEFYAPTPLPMAKNRGGQADYRELTLAIEKRLNQRLNDFGREHRLTLNTLVQGAWAALLSRYSGERDVVFGVTTSGRQVPVTGIEGMLGLFINTLPLRVKLESEEILGTLQAIQHQQQQNDQYAYTALADIRNWSEVPNGVPLFDTIMVFENYPVDEKLKGEQETGALQITDFQAIEYTNYPITLAVIPGQRLQFRLGYDSNRFSQETVERMLGHLTRLLEGVVENPGQPWHRLSLLTKVERQQLLAWNRTDTEYPEDRTIVDLFQEQVQETPDNIAVVFEDRELTYGELNGRANRLAHYLIALGVEAETLVGICVERSLEMVVGLMGILKAGGAYVPLDPEYPPERLQFMLEDARVPVLLTQSSLLEGLPATDAQTVCLDSDWEAIAGYSGENPARRSGSGNLAYVIYTSGSTGKPKGVMIEHNALANFLYSMQGTIKTTSGDKLAAVTTLSFDIAALELYLPLMTGAQIVLISRNIAYDGKALKQQLLDQSVTIMQATPATWKLLVQNDWSQNASLTILCGGEPLPSQLGKTLLENSQRFWNVYGPTETTIWSSIHDVNQYSEKPEWIGHPIANTRIFILDTHHNPIPSGIPGELCIAGAGLARGYLNRPELTAEKFMEVEVFGKPERLYKTGDLARWLPDGNLEYLGRMDHQIKLRGFRIELGEIEATLNRHEAVREAVVVLYQGDDNPRLAAYVTLAMPMDDAPGTLRPWLKEGLPEYMIPASFTVLDEIPLTPNGKIDRKVLSRLSSDERSLSGKGFVAPRDTVELQLARIWEDILNARPIGIRDNFFELGGDSLLAIRLIAHMEQALGKKLPLAVLFQSATIEGLAVSIRQQMELPWSPLISIQPKGSRPPLFFAPPWTGHGIAYLELARYFGKEQPFYGLQASGLEKGQKPHTKIEDVAALFLDALQTIQPEGPYHLAGWSFGGWVAIEMARQLRAQDQEVSFLGLLDSVLPSKLPKEYPEQDEVDILMGIFGHNIPLSLEDIRQMEPDGQLTYVIEHCQRLDLLPPEFGREDAQRLLRVSSAHGQAERNYQPQPYQGKIIFFQAAEKLPGMDSDSSSGWDEFATRGLDIHQVPGNHENMVFDPHARVLAEKLKRCLEMAES